MIFSIKTKKDKKIELLERKLQEQKALLDRECVRNGWLNARIESENKKIKKLQVVYGQYGRIQSDEEKQYVDKLMIHDLAKEIVPYLKFEDIDDGSVCIKRKLSIYVVDKRDE